MEKILRSRLFFVVALMMGVLRIQAETQTIRVGIFQLEPLNFMDAQGNAQGLFPDLLRKMVADQDKWDVAFVPVTWAEGLKKLQTEEIDLMTSVAYTPERAKTMDYNRFPIIEVWGQVYTRQEKTVLHISDLSGMRIGVMQRDINGENFAELTKSFGVTNEVVTYPSHADVFSAVRAGEVDAGIAPHLFGIKHCSAYGLQGTPVQFAPISLFFAAKKGRLDTFLAEIDFHMAQWDAVDDSCYARLVDHWINSNQSWMKAIPEWVLILAGSTVVFSVLLFVINGHLRRKIARHIQALRENKYRLQVALEAGNIGVWTRNIKNGRLQWDARMHEIYDVPVDQFKGTFKQWLQYIHPDDRVQFEKNHRNAELSGKAFSQIFRIIQPDGTQRTIRSFGKIIQKEGDTSSHMIGCNLDITRQERIEQALRMREAEFRSMVDNLQVNVVVFDANFRILRSNPLARDTLGSALQVLAGRPESTSDWALLNDDQAELKPEEYPVNRVMASEKQLSNLSLGIRFPGHEGIMWVILSAAPVFNEQGKLVRIVVNFIDVTDRKNDALAVQRSREHLKTTLRSIGDAVIVTDKEGRVTLLNPVAESLTGWSQADALHQPAHNVFNIINENSRERTESPIEEVLARGSIVDLANHTLLISKDGREIPIADCGAPIRDPDGAISGVVLVFRDQTRERMARKKIEASKARLLRAQMIAQTGDWEIEISSGQVTCSDAALQIYGLSGNKQTLNHLRSIVLPEFRPAFEDALNNLLEHNIPYDVEFRIRRPSDGREVYIHSVADYDADAGLAFGVVQDITRRKDAELELQQLAQVQGLILDNSTLGIALVENRVFTWVNPRLCSLLGLTEEQLKGASTRILFPSEEAFEQTGRKAYEALGKGQRFDQSLQFQRGDGTLFWCRLTGKAIDPENPLSSGSLWMVEDISKRREDEAELLRLSTAIEQAAETVIITDLDGTIQYINPAGERSSGYTREEILGEHPRIFKGRDPGILFYRKLWATIQSGEVWEGRFENRRKDGSYYTEEACISPVRAISGRITNYVAVKRDISEELIREEELRQAQKMDAVGQLAAGVAHDFNNILQGILGFSEMLALGLDQNAQEYDFALEISKAARKAAELTRQLLAFSRKDSIQEENININDVIQDLHALLDMLLGENYELTFELEEDLPLILADHGQISQIIMNLAVNARDAMPDGGSLTISTKHITLQPEEAESIQGARPGNYLCISVADTGSGMEEAVLEHLFEPFFTTKEVGSGSGLGLSVVYGIVQRSHGWINVESEPGKGSNFIIYLPARESGAEDNGKCDDASEMRARILVVDDDPQVLELITEILESAGYWSLAVSSAEEALALLEKENSQFDLLMCDIVLPGMQGDELAAHLHELNPLVPTLLLSGNPDQIVRHKNGRTESRFFLEKPVTMSTLMETVEKLLSKKSSNRGI